MHAELLVLKWHVVSNGLKISQEVGTVFVFNDQ